MTIEEAIECLMYMLDNMTVSSHEEKAMDIAIRSLEAWDNLEPDAEYDDGDFLAYSQMQIHDSIAWIEKGGSDNG